MALARRLRRLGTATLACLLTHLAMGQEPPAATAAPKPLLQTITLNGYAEASYSVNVNRPASRLNQLRVFDFDDRKLKLDVAELVLQRAVAKPNEAGFRIDAVAGGSVPRVAAAAGLFRDKNGHAGDFDLQQLFLSYIVPLGNGLRIDAGKWLTHVSLETIAGYDLYNDNITRSFLFGYAVPGSHAGVKATYAFSKVWTAMFEVINGWDVVKDNNASKSLGAQLAITPVDGVAIYLNAIVGPERAADNHDSRTLGNIVATWKLSATSTVGLDAAWATEPNAVDPGVDATWFATALYARRALTRRFALNLRGELFDDTRGGTRTEARQRLVEATITPEARITSNVFVRSDLRLDRSTMRVFEKGTGHVSRQPTLLLGALVKF